MTTPRKTTLLQALPVIPSDPTLRSLAQLKVERFTGSTATTIKLRNKAVAGLEQVFKTPSGGPTTLLDPLLSTPDYTIAGDVITLHTAPLTTDVILIRYQFRAT